MDLTVTKLRRKILEILKDLPPEGIVITKRGRAVAMLVPLERRRPLRKGGPVTGPMVISKGSPRPDSPMTESLSDALFE